MVANKIHVVYDHPSTTSSTTTTYSFNNNSAPSTGSRSNAIFPNAKFPSMSEEEMKTAHRSLGENSNFAVFSGCLPRSSSPPKNTLIYDLSKYDITEIVAGQDFAIFVNRSGNCYLLADESEEKGKKFKSWMELGDVQLNGKNPVLIPFTVDDPIEMVFGHSFCVLLNKKGEVYFYPEISESPLCGKLDMNQFGGEKVVHCALGNEHAYFLTESGKIHGFGANSSGQLATGRWYSEHKLVQIPTSHIPEKIIKVYATYNTSLVLTESNEVWSCGDTTYNASGHKSGTNIKPEELTKIPITEKIIAIETGLFFVAMKTMTNKYLVFGYNNFSQFGKSQTLNERIDGPHYLDTFPNENIHNIVCGGYNSVIISQDRRYYIAGWTIQANFYPSQDASYNLIDLKSFLGINGPFSDLGVELCAAMGRYYTIFYSRVNTSRNPLNFRRSFKICDITIKTRNGDSNSSEDYFPNCMNYVNE